MGYFRPVNVKWTGVWGRYSSGAEHKGLDFSAPIGTPVLNGMDGVVQRAALAPVKDGWGWHVLVKYDDGNFGLYAHMSRVDVKVGQRVYGRQSLGLSGNTGRSDGPHVHWQVQKSAVYGEWNKTSWNYTSQILSYLPPLKMDLPFGNFVRPGNQTSMYGVDRGTTLYGGTRAGTQTQAAIKETVKKIQRLIGAYVDGIYGNATAGSVRTWQSRQKIYADGIVGPATWTKMRTVAGN